MSTKVNKTGVSRFGIKPAMEKAKDGEKNYEKNLFRH